MKKCYLSHNVIIMFFELLYYYIIVTHVIKINQISLSHLFFRNLFQKAFPVFKNYLHLIKNISLKTLQIFFQTLNKKNI